MARIRTIKPEIWQDEDLAEVSEAALILAIGLLNHSDDEGYFKANPGLIKAAIFPLRDPSVSIHGMLSELSEIGYLRVFEGSDGKKYGHIRGFTRHQKINRPSDSKIKNLEILTDDSVNDHGTLTPGKEQGTGNREQGTGSTSPSGEESPQGGDVPGSDRKPCPHKAIIEIYHDKLKACPRVREWNDARKGYLRSRWNEKEERQDLGWWSRFFEYVDKSDFLMGRKDGRDDKPPFIADLEWIVRAGNFAKIIEGKYHR